MMIDFALEAGAREGKSPGARRGDLPGLPAPFRPIMMTTMAALLAIAAAGAGVTGIRGRNAEAARDRGLWWPHLQPDAYAIHDAGGFLYLDRLLPLVRSAGGGTAKQVRVSSMRDFKPS